MDKKKQIELIGHNISSLRVKAKLTQEELAELIDVIWRGGQAFCPSARIAARELEPERPGDPVHVL